MTEPAASESDATSPWAAWMKAIRVANLLAGIIDRVL